MSRADPLAEEGSKAILLAFARYRLRFRKATRRAWRRFERREWLEGQRDARERLKLYRLSVRVAVSDLKAHLGPRVMEAELWREMKSLYSEAIFAFADVELAETFFNSVTRRILDTVGVDPEVEFVDQDFRRARPPSDIRVHHTFARRTSTAALVADVLAAQAFSVPYRDLAGDSERAAQRIEANWIYASDGDGAPIETMDFVDSVFFRGSGAYLVGRVRGGGRTVPIVIVLLNSDEGLEIDAVLSTESEVSVVFSYTRSYFHVEMLRPSEVVRFLHTLIPKKPIAELYMSLGYDKHGKTEMYRSLLAHLERTTERFAFSPGARGMVMIVFAMPSHEYVFKIIRDEFAYPKTTTRADVIRRYQLVFQHDRAGRLVEAQEFEHLTFHRDRFEPDLLAELETKAAQSVTIEGSEVAIHHLYIERRVKPLDLFLREAPEVDTVHALLDYGQAIRDLAASNIFPGDLLLKNFGVTRHGRVIFYDYDELCLVTDCQFRDLPAARSIDEEMSAEPWFYVAENDVFPEEFTRFLGLSDLQLRFFLTAHGAVVTADFWRELQDRHKNGEVLDIFPYPPSKRLPRAKTRST